MLLSCFISWLDLSQLLLKKKKNKFSFKFVINTLFDVFFHCRLLMKCPSDYTKTDKAPKK